MGWSSFERGVFGTRFENGVTVVPKYLSINFCSNQRGIRPNYAFQAFWLFETINFAAHREAHKKLLWRSKRSLTPCRLLYISQQSWQILNVTWGFLGILVELLCIRWKLNGIFEAIEISFDVLLCWIMPKDPELHPLNLQWISEPIIEWKEEVQNPI